MPDDKAKEMDTLIDPSLDKETDKDTKSDSDKSNLEKEGLLKEIKSERDKRHELEARLSELESKLESSSTNSNPNDSDLEKAAEALAPYFQKKGFITAQQKEDEDRAAKYARDLEDLSKKYDGSDGRPAFDPAEVAEYAKRTGNFNLEAAYRDMHWKELVDFEKRQSSSDYTETERPSSTSPQKSGERVPLTREFLAKRMAEPDGTAWYEKNRDKILAAAAKGLL